MDSFVTIPDTCRKPNLWTEALKLARSTPVFPCGADKRPLIATGFKAASADPDQVHEWWTQWPDAPIGVPAGPKFVVVDADLQHEDAQQWVEHNRHRIPLTRTQRTPSGGLHWLFAATDKVKCSASKLGPHIDTRGTGGYIIWWPACGHEVLHGDALAPVPDWMIEALAATPRSQTLTLSRSTAGARAIGAIVRSLDPPTVASVRGAVEFLAKAREGNRNSALFWTCCRLDEAVLAGVITEAEADTLLTSTARQIGPSDLEIVRTVRSAARYS